MDKIKKIAKYTINILAIVSALVAGINAVDGITIPFAVQIVQVIAVINGVISTYLLGQKAVNSKEEQFMEDNVQIETVEFKEELYQKNITENDFSNSETDGIGDDDNANN